MSAKITTDKALTPLTPRSTMRACLICSSVQTKNSFKKNGCKNCNFLDYKNLKILQEGTTQSFKGLIYINNPKESWVSRWLHLENYKPGHYALLLEEKPTDEILDIIDGEGVHYIDRTKSFNI